MIRGRDPMKILFLSPHFPWPLTSGGVTRTYHVLRELARTNEVVLAALTEDPDSADLSRLPFVAECRLFPFRSSRAGTLYRMLRHKIPYRVARYWSPPLFDARLGWNRFDIIWVNFMNMGQYLPDRRSLRPVVVLDQHNCDELVWRSFVERGSIVERIVGRLNLSLLLRWQRREFDMYDVVLEVSEQDAEVVRSKIPPDSNVVVLPNGVDTDRLRPAGGSADGATLLFCGSLDRSRNVDAVRVAVEDILPEVRSRVPDTRISVVGRNPTRTVRRLAERAAVDLHANVPDVAPYYERAALSLVPTRMGGGTKLKIFESLAMEVPVVTFEGHGLDHTDGLREAGSVEEFSEEIVRLLEAPSLRRRLGREGRKNVVEHYDWRVLVGEFETRLRRLTG